MAPTIEPELFTPLQIGPYLLKHRVVMAPLTRNRSEQPGDIPGDMMLEYYSQRASDGGFIFLNRRLSLPQPEAGMGRLGFITMTKLKAGKRSYRQCTAKARGCSRSFGIRGAHHI